MLPVYIIKRNTNIEYCIEIFKMIRFLKKNILKSHTFFLDLFLHLKLAYFPKITIWFEKKIFLNVKLSINPMTFVYLCSHFVIDIIKHEGQWLVFFKRASNVNSCKFWLMQIQTFSIYLHTFVLKMNQILKKNYFFMYKRSYRMNMY